MGLVTKPYDFNPHAAGAKVDSAQVDADFDTLYTLVNGNIEDANIKAGGVGTVSIANGAVTGAKIGAVIGVRVYHNADQTIANVTPTVLAFNSERFDTDALHDNAVNNSRLTCAVAGKYMAVAHITFAPNTTGMREIGIRKNGANIAVQKLPASSLASTEMTVSTIADLAVSDYLEVYAYQSSGGALAVSYVGGMSPEFMMVRLGA